MDTLPDANPTDDTVTFITGAAATLIAQRWGVRLGQVLKVLSSPEAREVTTSRYLLAVGSGLPPAEAAGQVGRSLLADAEQRAA